MWLKPHLIMSTSTEVLGLPQSSDQTALSNGIVMGLSGPSQANCPASRRLWSGLAHSFTDSPVHWPPSSVLPGTILLRCPHRTAHTQRLPSLPLSPSRPSEGAPVRWTELAKKKQKNLHACVQQKSHTSSFYQPQRFSSGRLKSY